MNLTLQEARVPLMLIDGLVVWGLTVLEKNLKNEKAAAQEVERIKNETVKQTSRAINASTIQKKKTEQRKQHVDKKASHMAPRSPIMQPDKNKKTH
jgi:hypothetical protein